jgi:hypothetical protein
MLVRKYAAVVLVTLSVAISGLGKTNLDAKLANIQIGNFGRINDSYYRGAQPKSGDHADLATLGIKTVIDLTRDGNEEEKGLVERAGMKFHRIPMTTTDRPSEAAVTEFLQLVNDPAKSTTSTHNTLWQHKNSFLICCEIS